MRAGISIAVLCIVLMIDCSLSENLLHGSGGGGKRGGGGCSTYPHCIGCAGKWDFRLCLMDRHLGVRSHLNIVINKEATAMAWTAL